MRTFIFFTVACSFFFSLGVVASDPRAKVRCVTQETVIYQPFFLTYEVMQLGEDITNLIGHLSMDGQDAVIPDVHLEAFSQAELLKMPSAVQLMALLGIDQNAVARCDIYKGTLGSRTNIELFAFIDNGGHELKKVGIFGDNIAICLDD